jgi:hypothetical protein
MKKITTKILKKALKVANSMEDLLKKKIDTYDLETLKEFKREFEKDLTKDEKEQSEVLDYVNERIKSFKKQEKKIKALYGK